METAHACHHTLLDVFIFSRQKSAKKDLVRESSQVTDSLLRLSQTLSAQVSASEQTNLSLGRACFHCNLYPLKKTTCISTTFSHTLCEFFSAIVEHDHGDERRVQEYDWPHSKLAQTSH